MPASGTQLQNLTKFRKASYYEP